jgi:hypothetical protein
MLNSNLKSDIQKNIKIKRLKAKKRSDRGWPSANTTFYSNFVKIGFLVQNGRFSGFFRFFFSYIIFQTNFIGIFYVMS